MKLRTITQRELRNDSGAVPREVDRFVPRATIAEASANAARIDAGQFRADLDAVVDPRPYD